MAIYIYRNTDGALVSYCPNDTDQVASADILAAKGLTAVYGLAQSDATHAWDPVTKTVISVTPPNSNISYFSFINAFTAAELAAIRASSDNKVQQFLFAIAATPQVDLSDTRMTAALNYLVTKALLTQARANTIAATVS